MSGLQNPDEAHYQKYHISRPLLLRAYQTSYDQLQGQLYMMIDHRKAVEEIKAAQKVCQDQWRIYDSEVVTLQRPGTKPPFFIKEVA